MPTSQQILDGLTELSNDWVAVAVAWHVVIGSAVVAMFAGWRPSRRLWGILTALPMVSVSVFAWVGENPFNGIVALTIAAALGVAAIRLDSSPIRFASMPALIAGAVMIVFGLSYPHFVEVSSPMAYVYAAPTGIVPCPTFSVMIGLALLAGGLESRTYSLVLAAGALVYGLFGTFRLGVMIDSVLLLGVVALVAVSFLQQPRS